MKNIHNPEFYYEMYISYLTRDANELLETRNYLIESNNLELYFFVQLAYVKKQVNFISPNSVEFKELENVVDQIDSAMLDTVLVYESALFYFFQGKFKKALSIFYDVLKELKNFRDKSILHHFLYVRSISNLYSITAIFSTRASEEFIDLLRKISFKSEGLKYSVDYFVGDYYYKMGKYKKAIVFLDKAMQHYKKINDSFNYYRVVSVKLHCLIYTISVDELKVFLDKVLVEFDQIPIDFLRFLFLRNKLRVSVILNDKTVKASDFDPCYVYLKSFKGHNYFYHSNLLNCTVAAFYKTRDIEKACELLMGVLYNTLNFYETDSFKYEILSTLTLYQRKGIQGQINFYKDKYRELKMRQFKSSLAIMKSNLYSHIILNIMNNLSSLINNRKIDLYLKYKQAFTIYLEKITPLKRQEAIKLQIELDLIKQFLSIEQTRNEKEIKIEFTYSNKTIFEVEVPPLILQPIIENSIKHGSRAVNGDLLIELEFVLNPNYLLVYFTDNIIRKKKEVLSFKKNSFGIPITNERLRLLDGLKNNNESRDKDSISYVTEKIRNKKKVILLKIPI